MYMYIHVYVHVHVQTAHLFVGVPVAFPLLEKKTFQDDIIIENSMHSSTKHQNETKNTFKLHCTCRCAHMHMYKNDVHMHVHVHVHVHVQCA